MSSPGRVPSIALAAGLLLMPACPPRRRPQRVAQRPDFAGSIVRNARLLRSIPMLDEAALNFILN